MPSDRQRDRELVRRMFRFRWAGFEFGNREPTALAAGIEDCFLKRCPRLAPSAQFSFALSLLLRGHQLATRFAIKPIAQNLLQ